MSNNRSNTRKDVSIRALFSNDEFVNGEYSQDEIAAAIETLRERNVHIVSSYDEVLDRIVGKYDDKNVAQATVSQTVWSGMSVVISGYRDVQNNVSKGQLVPAIASAAARTATVKYRVENVSGDELMLGLVNLETGEYFHINQLEEGVGLVEGLGLRIPMPNSDAVGFMGAYILEQRAKDGSTWLELVVRKFVASKGRVMSDVYWLREVQVPTMLGRTMTALERGRRKSSGLREAFENANRERLIHGGRVYNCLALPAETRDELIHEVNNGMRDTFEAASRKGGSNKKAQAEIAEFLSEKIAQDPEYLYDTQAFNKYLIANKTDALVALNHLGIYLINPDCWFVRDLAEGVVRYQDAILENRS